MPKTKKQPKEIIRTFELNGRTIIIDDFIYRRIFKDPDIKPKRKYRFIRSFCLACGGPRMVLKEGKNKTISLSRYIMKAGKGEVVDHINRNPLDNVRHNLRVVNPRLNSLNRKIRNNTGLICVSAAQYNRKFYVATSFRTKDGKRLTFKSKDTPFNRILAALARDKFVLQAGEEAYAPLNYPQWQFEPLRSILMKEDLGKLKEGSKDVLRPRSGQVKRQEVRKVMNRRTKCILRFCRKRAKSSHHEDTKKKRQLKFKMFFDEPCQSVGRANPI